MKKELQIDKQLSISDTRRSAANSESSITTSSLCKSSLLLCLLTLLSNALIPSRATLSLLLSGFCRHKYLEYLLVY